MPPISKLWARLHAPWVFLLVSAAFSTWLALAWEPGGTGRYDSATYVDGARHLAAGGGFYTCRVPNLRGELFPITLWAPGFSAMMVPPMVLGASPLQAASIALGISYVLCVLLVFQLAINTSGKRHTWLALLAASTFALQPSVLALLDDIMSDLPSGVPALASTLIAVHLARQAKPSVGLRVLVAVALATMFIIRFAGLLFAPGVLLSLVLAMRQPQSFWRRCTALWPTLLVFFALAMAWPLRNHALDRKPLGNRMFAISDPLVHATRAAQGIATIVTDAMSELQGWQSVAFQILLACSAIALIHICWVRRSVRTPFIKQLVVIIGSYAVLLVATASLFHFDSLTHPRFWLPLWPLIICTIVAILAHAKRRALRVSRIVVIAALVTMNLLFAQSLVVALPKAHQLHMFRSKQWEATAATLAGFDSCRLYITDPRPYLLHQEFGLISKLPSNMGQLKRIERKFPSVCIGLMHGRKPTASVAQRLPAQMRVVRWLKAHNRLKLVEHNETFDLYVLMQ